MDQKSAYAAARAELLREMLRAGAFDMAPPMRSEFVGATVRELQLQHDELDDTLARKLSAEGMQFTFGDATLAIAAARRRVGRSDDRPEVR